jgi:predicted dithiol-disulfide oxidoreductase (DUF899 family)
MRRIIRNSHGWCVSLRKTFRHGLDSGALSELTSSLSDAVREQQDFKPDVEDMPVMNVLHRDGGAIRHLWNSEILYVPAEPGQEYRHNDANDTLWNMIDLTPEGRGDFHPKLTYV